MHLAHQFVSLSEARRALERGSYTVALKRLSDLLALATDQGLCQEAYALLGVARGYLGDEDAAIDAFSTSIQVALSTRHFEYLPYRFFCDMEDLIWTALNNTNIRSGYGYPYDDDGFSLRSERMEEESSRRGEKRVPTWEEEERIARSAIRKSNQSRDIDTALSAISDGEYDLGIEILQDLSATGDAKAAYELACFYALESRDGTKEADAIVLLTQAAEQNLIEAQMKLAVILGDETRECYDPSLSTLWMTKVANAGDSNAQLQLAMKFMIGSGLEIDISKAAEWLEKSAASGNVNALFLLGCLFYEGNGVGQDFEKAGSLFFACIEKGMPQAAYYLGLLCRHGYQFLDAFKGNVMFENELEYWLKKSAMNGFPEAQYVLGMEQMLGQHLSQDYRAAYRWLSNAVANGVSAAADAIEQLREEIGEEEFEELSSHRGPVILWAGWPRDENDTAF